MTVNKDITESILAEYKNKEQSHRWYYSFLGEILEKEPILAEWIETSAAEALDILAQKYPIMFAKCPMMAYDIRTGLEQWFIRGFYMGMRKYTETLNVGMGAVTPLFEPKQHLKPKQPGWGEFEEVEDEDFRSPNSRSND